MRAFHENPNRIYTELTFIIDQILCIHVLVLGRSRLGLLHVIFHKLVTVMALDGCLIFLSSQYLENK